MGFSPKLSLTEDYLDGKLAIHLHMRLSFRGVLVARDLCAIFERSVMMADDELTRSRTRGSGPRAYPPPESG
jgi:hypothetical protein